MQIFNITPMGKPRQTRADKWKQREVVLRYRAFCDEVRLKKVVMPEAGSHITFILPMPDELEPEKTCSNGWSGSPAKAGCRQHD